MDIKNYKIERERVKGGKEKMNFRRPFLGFTFKSRKQSHIKP